MRRNALLATAIILTTASITQAESDKLGVTFDITYLSKWLSKGAEAYGQQGAVFETIDVDFYDTGFGVKVTHRSATASGYVDKQRFDYRPYYKNTLFQDKSYATNYNISVGYEHYYGLTRHKANTTYEWIFDFVPAYTAHYEYPVSGGDVNRKVSGWVHRFRLGYDLNVNELPAPLNLSSEVAYTDGLGGASHDWSYATFGMSTKFKITENMTFVPGVYQQISMDDSVNSKKDVTYCMLTMKYKF
jgi:hypothetical protein